MELDEAIKNIDGVCSAFVGNRQQHIAIQQSYEVIKKEIENKKGDKKQ